MQSQDPQLLAEAIKQCTANGVPEKQGDIQKAKLLLEYIVIQQGMLNILITNVPITNYLAIYIDLNIFFLTNIRTNFCNVLERFEEVGEGSRQSKEIRCKEETQCSNPDGRTCVGTIEKD